jgi:hypothetical protein
MDDTKSNLPFTELVPGLEARQNPNGYLVVRLHYSADPDGKTEEQRRQGIPEDEFEREHNLSFIVKSGSPVFGEYSPVVHTSADLDYRPGAIVWAGIDFGYHHPAVVYAQKFGDDSFWVLGELMGTDISLPVFVTNYMKPYEGMHFPGAKFIYTADIAGQQVTDKTEHSSFMILNNYKIYPLTRKTEINAGLELIRKSLIATAEGKKGFKLNPNRAPLLAEALQGGYAYAPPKPGFQQREMPKKDGYYDHLVDALRYIMVNAYTLWEKPEAPPAPAPETFVQRALRGIKK